MSKDHQHVLLDDKIRVSETFVKLVAILIDDIVERYSNISESNHNIAADIGIRTVQRQQGLRAM